MTTTHTTGSGHRTGTDGPTTRAASDTTTATHYLAGVLRLALGWTFLWAFLDKTFGLGYATEDEGAWIDGGSPTEGFLSFAATGPFKDIYNDIAGQTWADWLFMIGLAGIGIALILGVFVNIAAASGAVLMVLMWTVVLPPENNPFMDDHLILAGLLGLLALLHAGRYLGLGAMWERIPFVQNHPVLR